MRHEISLKTLNMLSSLKLKGLLIDGRLVLIENYTVEKVTVTPKKSLFNRHPEPKKTIYLTGIKVWGYNEDGKFLGTLSEEYFITLMAFNDLYFYRRKYEVLKEALNALGFDILPIKKEEPKIDELLTVKQ